MSRLLLLLVALLILPSAAPRTLAQPAAALLEQWAPERLTPADYARAESFLSWNVNRLVYNVPEAPEWLAGDRLWYRNPVRGGHEFIVVDAQRRTRERAFDHERLARVLSEATGVHYEALALPLTRLRPAEDGRSLGFELERQRWQCDIVAFVCERHATPFEQIRDGRLSPDGTLLAFRREHNLWVQDLRTGEEVQLTFDGIEHYGYATDSEGWRRSERPALKWSPDSRRIFTHRLDERGVGEMVLWTTREGRPNLVTYRYAIPGDSIVPMYQWVVIDVQRRALVPLRAERDHQRRSACCGMLAGDALADVQWAEDASWVAYVSTSRDYTTVTLRLADPVSGEVREVFSETLEPYFESSGAGRGVPNWRVLRERDRFIWHSPRSGWHHLYLYDLDSGELLRPLTAGSWNVVDVVHVDAARGVVFFTGVGREAGRDPYHRHLYALELESGAITLLTPDDADRVISVAPSGRFFLETHSRMDVPPTTVLRDAGGALVMTLERADIADLLATGWPKPIPFTAKARDGETEIFGLMYRPSNFDPSRRYPIINNIYPGPQVGSIGPRTFQPGRRGQAQALAELGFIVVQIDALGTPLRSFAFHHFYHGNLADNGLPDQIAAMRQLAERYPWIDVERAGIYGHSGGGFATVAALLQHPYFFQVGVASAGNLDNRGYTFYWGEKWQGPLVVFDDGTDSYTNQAMHLLAGNLEGRLLLSYGTMDSNVHPVTTLLLVDALIAHNKDFDLMVFPNRDHGYANEPYKLRITWDYFVRHLLGAEPPRGFRIRGAR